MHIFGIFLVVLAIILTLYLVFCTSFIDRLFFKLGPNRVRRIRESAEQVTLTAAREAYQLRREQRKTESDLKDLESIQTPTVRRQRAPSRKAAKPAENNDEPADHV